MRESRWQNRVMAIIPAGARDGANAAHTLHWPGGDAEIATFDVPLSATGLEPATHYGTSTSATDALWMAWRELIDAGGYPGLVWYRLDRNGTVLAETNSATASAGDAWTWQDALDDLGLKRVEVDDDGI